MILLLFYYIKNKGNKITDTNIDWEDPRSFLTDEVISKLAQHTSQSFVEEVSIFDQVGCDAFDVEALKCSLESGIIGLPKEK